MSHESSVQTLLSSQFGATPPTQTLPAQVSAVVQASPSLQLALLAAFTQPAVLSHESSVQTLLSSQFGATPPTQTLPAHVSAVVQALPSSQLTLLATLTQPFDLSQESSVHTLPSSQPTAPTPTQAPALQESPVVQASPSSHAAPSFHAANWHLPLVAWHSACRHTESPLVSHVTTVLLSTSHLPFARLHTSVPLHASASSNAAQSALAWQPHVLLPPTHAPPWHWSPAVQGWPSLQAAVLGVCWQPPTLAQASSVQGLPSSQPMAGPPTQAPSLQASPKVQALPSSQPAFVAMCLQPLVLLQSSSVQLLPSSHAAEDAPLHAPALHVSPNVHASPSSHGAALGECWQPPVLSQVSSVHGLSSSQLTALATHCPAWQTSPAVQASPSSQAAELATC